MSKRDKTGVTVGFVIFLFSLLSLWAGGAEMFTPQAGWGLMASVAIGSAAFVLIAMD